MKNEQRTVREMDAARRAPWRVLGIPPFFVAGSSSLILLWTALAFAAARGAEPPASPQRLLDRAVAAMGGAEAVARLRCYRLEEEGAALEGNAPKRSETRLVSVTWEAPPARLKMRQTQTPPPTLAGAPRPPQTTIQTLDGDRGWAQEEGKPAEDLPAAHVAELRAYLASPRLQRLGELAQRPDVALTALPRGRVDGKPADQLRAEAKGQPAVVFSFDADTGLLAKTETSFRDAVSGAVVKQEIFWSDYRPAPAAKPGGAVLRYPHKQLVYVDGNRSQELTVTRLELLDKIDPAEFAKPVK